MSSSNPQSAAGPKLALLDQVAQMARAIGHRNRLEILELLAQGERSVESVSRATGLSVANASQHLQTLRRNGLVLGLKSGKHSLYRLTGDEVLSLLVALRRAGESHLGEMQSTWAKCKAC